MASLLRMPDLELERGLNYFFFFYITANELKEDTKTGAGSLKLEVSTLLSLPSVMTVVRGEKGKWTINPRVEGLSASLCSFAPLSSDGGERRSTSVKRAAALAGAATKQGA